MALDIGGANIKVAAMIKGTGGKLRFTAATHVFPMWKQADELEDFLKAIRLVPPPCDVAVTMTAELADVFPTKREGVIFVLRATQRAFPDLRVQVLTVNGELINLADAFNDPLSAAGANWAASAWAAAQIFQEGILGDTGSTTTDLIPFVDGHIASRGKTDPDRMASGELVYTGYLRTPCSHLAKSVPWRGAYCRVSSEYFTIAGDVHLVLGNIRSGDYHWPTPDGRGTTLEDARARLARLICGDTEMLSECEIMSIAGYLYHRQVQQVEEALYQIMSRLQKPIPLICAGSGKFLLAAAGSNVGLKVIEAAKVCGAQQAEIFPAWSLCVMLAAKQEGMQILDQFKCDD